MTQLNYHLIEAKEAPYCLIFIHGMACDQEDWHEQVNHFSSVYSVLTIDLPGHGLSVPANSTQQWTMEALAKSLKELIDTLNIQTSFVIIGHSASVRIVIELYQLLKTRTHGLVLIDCGYQQWRDPNSKDWQKQIEHKGYLTWLKEFFEVKLGPYTPQPLRNTIMAKALSLDESIAKALFQNIITYDHEILAQRLKEIDIPILVLQASFYLQGIRNDNIQSEWLNLIKSTQPHATIKIFQQCGHWLMLQQPTDCNHYIAEFIDTLS